jgi:predicted membrane protein
MNDDNPQLATRVQNFAAFFKSWMMVALTLIFVSLYTASLFGWLQPLTDTTVLSRLEPIIFVVIGFYFGRLLALQIEKTLKTEISRQTQKADAAQYAKEQAQQQREIFEEKLRNVEAALRADSFDIVSSIMPGNGGHSRLLAKTASNKSAIGTALKILNS